MNKYFRYRLVALIVAAALFPVAAQSQLIINELMQSNIDCCMDYENDYPESWVGLYKSCDTYISIPH